MFNNKVYFPPGLCWQCRLSLGWPDTQLLLSPCWPCCGNWEKNRRDLLKTLSIQNVQEVWRGTPWLSEELKPCGITQIINKTKHKSNHRDETWGIWWRLYLDCVWTHVGWGEGTIVGILTHQPEKNDDRFGPLICFSFEMAAPVSQTGGRCHWSCHDGKNFTTTESSLLWIFGEISYRVNHFHQGCGRAQTISQKENRS